MELVGLEAASRGAKKVLLCDKSKEAIKIIKKNVQKTKLQEKIEIYNLDFIDLIQNRIYEKPDFIYIDPPYESDFAVRAVQEFLKVDKVKLSSIFIIETDKETEVIEKIKKLPVDIIDYRRYGRAHLIFLQKCQSDRKG
mgnify:CR=1 FL=1